MKQIWNIILRLNEKNVLSVALLTVIAEEHFLDSRSCCTDMILDPLSCWLTVSVNKALVSPCSLSFSLFLSLLCVLPSTDGSGVENDTDAVSEPPTGCIYTLNPLSRSMRVLYSTHTKKCLTQRACASLTNSHRQLKWPPLWRALVVSGELSSFSFGMFFAF